LAGVRVTAAVDDAPAFTDTGVVIEGADSE
jgi:hypothetical protein